MFKSLFSLLGFYRDDTVKSVDNVVIEIKKYEPTTYGSISCDIKILVNGFPYGETDTDTIFASCFFVSKVQDFFRSKYNASIYKSQFHDQYIKMDGDLGLKIFSNSYLFSIDKYKSCNLTFKVINV